MKKNHPLRDLGDDIRDHIERETRDNVDRGMTLDDARYAALRKFGNITLTAEATRQVWYGPLGEYLIDLLQDIRYAGRQLKRSAGYSATVILVLGLGIAANVSVFRLFEAVFLNPLPGVANAHRLAVVLGRGASGDRAVTISYLDYQYLREHNTSFADLVASSPAPFSLGLGTNGERVWGEMVSDNYFQVLGIEASRGRTLQPSDYPATGGEPVVVISDGLWRRTFGADTGIVGKTVLINARRFTVVGVAEPGFHGSMVSVRNDLFLPLTTLASRESLTSSSHRWLIVLGPLRPGVTLQSAKAQTAVLADQLAAAEPIAEVGHRADVLPFWRSPFGAQTLLLPLVAVFAVMAGLVLVIVCTNLANLALARGLERRAESAVRVALGAGRIRIIRLLLMETLMLAVPAAALGLLLAVYAPGASSSEVASVAPSQLDLSTSGLVVGFALLVSCGSALLFSLVPALRAASVAPVAVINQEGSIGGRRRTNVRGALVAVQIATSLVLLVAAGLTLRTVNAARHADIGFDASNTVSVSVDLGLNEYDESRGLQFYGRLLERLHMATFVESAALAAVVPLRMIEASSRRVFIEGYQPRADEDMRLACNVVSPDYFRTLRIKLLAGREFQSQDLDDSMPVVIVNETLARRFWREPAAAIGKRLKLGSNDSPWRTIVGVSRDIKYLTLTEAGTSYFYLPFEQSYRSDMTIHVRGTPDVQRLIEHVRDEVRGLDPNLPIVEARTLAEQARVGTFLYEAAAAVLVAFGLMAMGIAAVGIYGLVAYDARQRRREIGIRTAIGAHPAHIVRQFLSRGVRLGTIGVVMGLAFAQGGASLMIHMLYGVRPTDPLVLGGAALLVLGTTLVASLIPAWRAAQISAVTTLRQP